MLFAAALGLPMAFLYAMFTQVMPRSGGDYVFNSRILHPAIGFAANFSFCLWVIVSSGIYTTYIANYGFGAFARTMAGFTGATGWLSFGEWFSTDWGLFMTGSGDPADLRRAVRRRRHAPLLPRSGLVLRALHARRDRLAGGRRPAAEPTGFIHNFNAYAANLGAHARQHGTRRLRRQGRLQRRRSSA